MIVFNLPKLVEISLYDEYTGYEEFSANNLPSEIDATDLLVEDQWFEDNFDTNESKIFHLLIQLNSIYDLSMTDNIAVIFAQFH